mmetsp:Transcript_53909/g.109921  ORF Transcript_53909/g.109921 Transcript_53909/m.109921 type:complete len:705 (-) Transcript_53909:236-2350(-)
MAQFSVRPTMPNMDFVATPENDTLEALLMEAFAVIEMRYALLDRDGAGMMMFSGLASQLALKGFDDSENLARVWKKVDADGSGCLDFAEFLCLLFLWANVGSYENIFDHKQNCKVVAEAFQAMEQNWAKYDSDKSRKFNHAELQRFLSTEIPGLWEESQPVVDNLFPVSQREAGRELTFPRFMHMLYVACAQRKGSRIPGKYADVGIAKNVRGDGTGEDSSTWKFFKEAFLVMESDFLRFDKSGDGYIDYSELTLAVPDIRGAEKLQILCRLENKFKQVDMDGTKTVDFFEFIYLGLLMSQDGSYSDLVPDSEQKGNVMKAFLQLCTYYQQADRKKTRRLCLEDVRYFFQEHFSYVPPNLEEFFKQVCYESASAPGEKVVDIVRFLKLVYWILCPTAKFDKNSYAPKKAHRDPKNFLISHAGGSQASSERPKRIDPVINDKFVKVKKLGEGGQGAVFLGTYEGQKVAGKEMFGQPTKEILEDLINEVTLLQKLDHPSCHYLIGAKIEVDHIGGPLLLTEICEEGSLFDLYAKKQMKFDPPTSWRIAKECALGFEHIHSLGFMHRDIKSLNVFMAKGFSARVADFGMAVEEEVRSEACGTVQWMAPEVLANFKTPGSSPYNKRCDIFSYGVLLWEIFHCTCPYADTGLDQMLIAKKVLKDDIRPSLSPRVAPDVRNLICHCWDKSPQKRPQTFTQVLQALEHIKH